MLSTHSWTTRAPAPEGEASLEPCWRLLLPISLSPPLSLLQAAGTNETAGDILYTVSVIESIKSGVRSAVNNALAEVAETTWLGVAWHRDDI
jgi:hypothetical protein